MAVSDDSCRVNPSPEDASHQDSLYYEAVNDALGRSGPSDNLEGDYTPLRLGRAPRAIRESATRTLVVGYLRTAFDKHRFDHHLLAPNGDLQISIGSGFVFGEKSPGVLQEQVQELTKVLREYLRVLAAAASLENRPFRLEVIGYASPSYRGMPQVGYDPSDRGAVYNRVVGMQRAETVVKLMRTLPGADSLTIEALSMGSEGGIVDATGSNSKCGDFDCIASRRVVVRFHADGPGLGVEGDSLLSH